MGSSDNAPATGDLHSRLQQSLGTTYALERELGGGGMSRVFLATESRLRRSVVVKVLTPELAADVSVERFEREIVLAAQLSHPSIVPVLTAGDANGLPYYTMPFVEGQSLRARLAAGGPPPQLEAISILRDVARALSYAHDHGIVHRDIKPDNVLLAGDAAVVTDFGIAKAITVARADGGSSTLTTAGSTLGTPAYMSPEQATGDPAADFRSDIYSFGCLAFELLSGEPPFGRRPGHQLLAAHLAERPPDILVKCADCPRALATIVMRCLEKNPATRPQSAREILQVLDAVITGAGEAAPALRAMSRRTVRRVAPVVAILLVIAAVAVALIQSRGTGHEARGDATVPRSIAVLPFSNVGPDTADAYFADGMSEELGTALSKVRGLRVVAPTFRSAGRDVDPNEVGKTLGVDALLTGTVRRAGDEMRLNVKLTRVRDGSVLWSEQYRKTVRHIFAVQDEMASAIVSALRVQLSPTGATSVAALAGVARGTSNLEAYDQYLRGQANLRRRGAGIRVAAAQFEAAIAKDTGFARAYSGLSAALALLPYFAAVPPDSVFGGAMTAARHALARDSTLAEAHTSMALAYQHAFQWQRAEEEHRRAIAADSTDAQAHMHYARFLTSVARPREALDEALRAKSLDRYSAVIAAWVATTLRLSGKLDAAVIEATRAIELDSVNPPTQAHAAQAFLAVGRKADARAAADRIPRELPLAWAGIMADVHGMSGDPAPAVRLIRDIEQMRPRPWGAESSLAWALLGIGDSTRALAALERALDAREMWPSFFSLLEPMYDPVRHSARFATLVRRVGLDPALFMAPSR